MAHWAIENINVTQIQNETQGILSIINVHLEDTIIDKDQWIILGLTLPIFAGLSLVLNTSILVTLLLAKNKLESSSNLFLQALACFDIGFVVISFYIFSVPVILQYLGISQHYLQNTHPYLVPYLLPVYYMFLVASDFTTVAVAVERYLAIGHNFRSEYKLNHHLGCSLKSTKWYILKIIVFSIGFSIPEFFKWQIFQDELENGHETSTLKVITTEFDSDIVTTIQYTIFSLTPWLFLMWLWLGLRGKISFLTKKNSMKRTLTLAQYEEAIDANFVLVLIGMFYLTNGLRFYMSFSAIMDYKVPKICQLLAELFLVINSSLKFVVYILFNKSFRSAFFSKCE